MTTILEQSTQIPITPPRDLRQALGDDILLKLALDAVQSLNPERLNTAISGKDKLRPQMMLTLLSFCYATRLFGSRDIEWAARHDKTVRYICAHTFPEWRVIRHFRRHNRELVERCLTYVLKKAWILYAEEAVEEQMRNEFSSAACHEKVVLEACNKIEAAMITDMAESD